MVQPVQSVYVTAPFRLPGSWAAGYHTGIDYRASVGTPIYATKRGKVLHAGWGGWGNAYGHHVVIQSWHGGKRVRHLYAHLSGDRVFSGQKVRTGQLIGFSGDTGNTTGPHLHYEERLSNFTYYRHRNPVLPGWTPRIATRPTISLRNARRHRKTAVRKMQRHLNKKMPGRTPLVVDGIWGPSTARRWVQWERKIGVKSPNRIPHRRSLKRLGFIVLP